MKKLALWAAVLGSLIFSAAGVAATLDPVKVEQVAHIQKLLDQLPMKTYPITLTNSALYTEEWEVEILPWYAYEGIADPVIPPQTIEYFFAPFGQAGYINNYIFHILGLSQCEVIGLAANPFDGTPTPVAGPIFLNGRFINPVSPWYQEADWLPTLVHELGHSQGICVGASPYVESSTQLATLEVMSAMVNSGNDKAVLGLLTEWQSIIEGTLQYEAIRDHIVGAYDRMIADVTHGDARVLARRSSSERFWAKGQKALKGILQRYEWSVYLKATYAVEFGSLTGCIPAEKCGPLMRANAFVPSGGDLVMDDFTYFLANMDARVAQIAAGK